MLGGYYLIDVDTLDEALEWAAKIPAARYGTIEVRPIVTDSRRGRVIEELARAYRDERAPLDRDPRPRPR